MRVNSFSLMLGVGVFLLGQLVWADGWRLAKDEAGIQVYLRAVAGSNYQEYRGVVTLDTEVETLLTVQDDATGACAWIHSCQQQRLVGREGVYSWVYSRFDAPWPVSPRDAVVRVVTQRGPEGQITRLLQGAADYMPAQQGFIRISKLVGHWTFTPKAAGQVEVIYQVHAEPGGSVPSWLANSFVVDAPYETLKALRLRVENR